MLVLDQLALERKRHALEELLQAGDATPTPAARSLPA